MTFSRMFPDGIVLARPAPLYKLYKMRETFLLETKVYSLICLILIGFLIVWVTDISGIRVKDEFLVKAAQSPL